MLNEDSIQFARENTRVILAPQSRIETFGSTVFRYYVVTELMDTAQQVRVRDGRMHAERPSIITPEHLHQFLPEGFGDKAEAFIGFLRETMPDLAILKYGFQFRKSDMQEEVVHSSLEEVVSRVREQVDRSGDPLSTIIQSVDEGWEVSLLEVAADLVQRSAPGNVEEWRRRGLLGNADDRRGRGLL